MSATHPDRMPDLQWKARMRNALRNALDHMDFAIPLVLAIFGVYALYDHVRCGASLTMY